MAQDRDEYPVRITRIDDDLGDLLPVPEPQVDPRLAGIGGTVDAVAHRQVWALHTLAAAHIDDVRIRLADRDRTDGAGGLIVEDRGPGAPIVGGLPKAAVDVAGVEQAGPARDADRGFGPPTAVRADHPPPHVPGQGRVQLLRGQGRVSVWRHEGEQRGQTKSAEGVHAFLGR